MQIIQYLFIGMWILLGELRGFTPRRAHAIIPSGQDPMGEGDFNFCDSTDT